MDRRLGIDVVEGQHVLVLVDLPAWDLAAQDPGEDVVGVVGQSCLLFAPSRKPRTQDFGRFFFSSTPLVPSRAASASHTSVGVTPTSAHNTSRSEEHTSELQSLMRISYAVFC